MDVNSLSTFIGKLSPYHNWSWIQWVC